MKYIPHKPWPKEMLRYLEKITPGHHYKEITEMMNKKFNLNLDEVVVSSAIRRHKFRTGFDGRFVKGQPSHNKGQKVSKEVYEKIKKGFIKPGTVPANKRPLGSERINVDGYVEVKIAEPSTWELKHRVVWQQAYGPIPKGMIVILKDNNKQNCSLDNLEMISMRDNAYLNQHKLRSDDPQVTECGVLMARIDGKIKERRKNGTSTVHSGK